MPRLSGRPVLMVGGALLLVLTGGCSRIREHQGFIIDPLIVNSVLPGVDNRESVQGSLGHPTFVSQFGSERWYYVARNTKTLAFGTPRPTAQTIYMVEFDKGGNVSLINEDSSLDKVARLSPSGDKTPTLGRKRSIFDDIFGNIGAVGAGGLGGQGQGGGGPGPNGG